MRTRASYYRVEVWDGDRIDLVLAKCARICIARAALDAAIARISWPGGHASPADSGARRDGDSGAPPVLARLPRPILKTESPHGRGPRLPDMAALDFSGPGSAGAS